MSLTSVKIWNLILRLYAALLAIYGVFLTIFVIYITFTASSEEQSPDYAFLAIVPFAIIMFWAGYISARKLTFSSIKILTALTILLLLSTVIEIFDLFIGPSFQSESVSSAITMLLSLPVAFILYLIIVKLLSSLSFIQEDK